MFPHKAKAATRKPNDPTGKGNVDDKQNTTK